MPCRSTETPVLHRAATAGDHEEGYSYVLAWAWHEKAAPIRTAGVGTWKVNVREVRLTAEIQALSERAGEQDLPRAGIGYRSTDISTDLACSSFAVSPRIPAQVDESGYLVGVAQPSMGWRMEGASGRRGSTAVSHTAESSTSEHPAASAPYCVLCQPSDARKQPDTRATIIGGQQGQPGGKRRENTDQTARRAQTGRAQPESPNHSTVAFIRANQSPHSPHGKLAASQQPAWVAGKGGLLLGELHWDWARLTLPHLVDPKGAGTPQRGRVPGVGLAWHSLTLR